MRNECVRCGREIVLDTAVLLPNDHHETADFNEDFLTVLLCLWFAGFSCKFAGSRREANEHRRALRRRLAA